jgi:uncharacterized DUF497 family protein
VVHLKPTSVQSRWQRAIKLTLWVIVARVGWGERSEPQHFGNRSAAYVGVRCAHPNLRLYDPVILREENDRFSYGEQRFITLGLLAGIPVSIAHTETTNEIRIISFRKATRREEQIHFSRIQN